MVYVLLFVCFLGGAMTSNAQTKSDAQPRNGIIRKILNLLSITMPKTGKAKSKTSTEHVQAKAKQHSNSKKPVRSHAKLRAKPHSKHKSHSTHAPKKVSTKSDHSLHNPKDVIPESPADPAHSPGHRHLHIDKELH
jgi:hypothetical protein